MSNYTNFKKNVCCFCLSENIKNLSLVSHLEGIPAGLSRSNEANFQGILCNDCKSVTSSRLFNEDLYVDGFYSKSENYDRISPSYDYTGSLVKKIISASKKGKVLDFGAGQGAAAIHMQNLGAAVDVLDPDKGYQNQLKSNFDYVMSDIKEIKDKYSCIYAIGVLEHLSDIPDVVTSLYQKLDEDGILVFQYPNPKGFSARFNFNGWDMLFESGHNFIPSADGLHSMLSRHGIYIESSYSSSIISRGRLPFFGTRTVRRENLMKSLIDKYRIVKYFYKLIWELQGLLGLGETLVVTIKKNSQGVIK